MATPGKCSGRVEFPHFTLGGLPDVDHSLPTTPLSLALRFSAFTMREIGLVIAPLDPRHKSEALFNRICLQGQHDLEEPAQLRHRECWRFFPPDALSSAREKNGPAA